jgi:hypothetical protein
MTEAAGELWGAVDRLLQGAEADGILVHRLGALAARRLRRLGRPVPPELNAADRAAATSAMLARPLLERIRSLCDGPLVLIKGPEVARLYPGGARNFSDVDLLVLDPRHVHDALKAKGFVEVDDPELFVDHHHLRPLLSPSFGLKVEIHSSLPWPDGIEPPALREIVEAAGPSKTGVEGISAPADRHHALILAAHAWVHDPLGTLRDVVDVAAVAAGIPEHELDRAARAWGIHRIWRTTSAVAGALLDGRPQPLPLRIWARHLEHVRERTVLENHLERWLHSFSERPPAAALGATVSVLRQEFLPTPGEPWRHKLIRVAHAFRHPRAPLSSHIADWRKAATRDEADERRVGRH